jgi:excisionase family DNA binding protein
MLSGDSAHAKKKRKRRKRPRKPPSREALLHSIGQFCARANISKPTAYRMMKDGQLRYAQLRGKRMIPTEEYVRLGIISEDVAARC